MKTIAIAILVALGALAGRARADDTCAANGQPLLAIAHRIDPAMTKDRPLPFTESRFALTTTGAWTFVETDQDGKTTRQASGCLDAKRLASVRRDLDRASWKTSRAEMTCMGMSPAFTELHVRGKLRWTERMCQPEHLDAKTTKIVEGLAAMADQLVKAAADPKPAPSECAVRGEPIVEIDLVVDQGAKLPSAVTKVYATGAWTKQRVSADGAKRPPDQGCLAADRLADVTKALDAPWTVTRARITCKAYSLSHTIWKIRGTQVIDQRVCGAEQLDAASDKALGTIKSALAALPPDGD